MANTLLINKLTGGYFQFVLNGDTTNAVRGIKNDLLAVGNQLHFKTGNGANIIKEQFIYPADLTIVASGTFTFTNVDQVWTKLIEIGYFDWINSGGSNSGADRFDDLLDTFKYTGKDGQVVIVNESQQKLQTIPLYNYRKFTELEDTPDLLIANKMVATNEAGTALIFKNLPEDPVNYLNSIGFFDYNDLATQSTPISVASNTDVKLTNDTLGAFTNISYPPYGVSFLWDSTTNRFNFTQLSIGDTIDVRIHLQVTTTTSNQSYKIGAKFGIGSESVFDNIIYSNQVKTAGVHEVSFVAPFYIGEANILNNPAELYINSDATASVKVDGWYIRILRRNINIVNVETGVDDATTTVKGIVRLAGDLAGTSTNPTVPELANKALKSTTITINGTTFDLSANREWTITGSANWGSIGGVLSNQTDLQTALNGKQNSSADLSSIAGLTGTSGLLRKTAANTYSLDTNTYALDNSVVKLTGNQSISGEKTFSGTIKADNAPIFDSGIRLQLGLTSLPLSGYGILSANSGNGLIYDNGSITSTLNFGTGNRTYTFPNKNGTVAMLDDITGGNTGSLEFNSTDLTVWNNGKGNIVSNTSFGDAALKSNTSGVQNTAIGLAALELNTTGGNNTTVGFNSLKANTSGFQNTAVGASSLESNTTGANNTAIGLNSMKASTTGVNNTSIGSTALEANTTGGNNVAIGQSSLSANTTGGNNVAIGQIAGRFLANGTTGNGSSSNSIYIGTDTRSFAASQTNEIVIGHNAIGNGSNTVTLGNSSIVTTILRGNVGIGTTSPSQKLEVLDTSVAIKATSTATSGFGLSQFLLAAHNGTTVANSGSFFLTNSTFSYGQISPNQFNIYGTASNGIRITTTVAPIIFSTGNSDADFSAERMRITSGGNVVIANLGTGSVFSNAGVLTNTNPSDERLKENIDDLEYGLTEILQLRPVTYNWINDTANQGKQFGFIAQEVQEIMPDLINEFTITEDEEEVVRLGLDKEAIFVAMVNAIKELKAEIELLKK